jgi:hypothetical protein
VRAVVGCCRHIGWRISADGCGGAKDRVRVWAIWGDSLLTTVEEIRGVTVRLAAGGGAARRQWHRLGQVGGGRGRGGGGRCGVERGGAQGRRRTTRGQRRRRTTRGRGGAHARRAARGLPARPSARPIAR